MHVPLPRNRGISAFDWLGALAEELHALVEDYYLDPFSVQVTELARRILQKMRVPHQVYNVGASYFTGTGSAWLQSFGALPATDAEIQDYFRTGGLYYSAGYGADGNALHVPYLIVQVRDRWILDLSGSSLFALPEGNAAIPSVLEWRGEAIPSWRTLHCITEGGDSLLYQRYEWRDLSEFLDAEGQAAFADEIERVLWDRLEYYGWPVSLAGPFAREVSGHG